MESANRTGPVHYRTATPSADVEMETLKRATLGASSLPFAVDDEMRARGYQLRTS